MITLRKPDRASIDRWLAEQRNRSFNYPEAGATRETPPARGYDVDRYTGLLGHGEAVYERAVAAIRELRMWDFDWIQLCWPDTPVEVGAVLATLTRQVGLWFLNPCRIVYRVDEQAPSRRYGFAYGTLQGHVERGEERFTVEQRAEDGAVWYEIMAFSRPAHWLVRLGYPYARRLQRRFGADSVRAMMNRR